MLAVASVEVFVTDKFDSSGCRSVLIILGRVEFKILIGVSYRESSEKYQTERVSFTSKSFGFPLTGGVVLV